MFLLFIWCFQLELKEASQWSLEAHEIFTANLSMAVGEAHRMALLDPTQHKVLLLSPATSTTFGRKGQGPGEMENPIAIFWFEKNQSFLIHDNATQKLLEFDSNGLWQKDYPLPPNFHQLLFTEQNGYAIENPYAHGGSPAKIWMFDLETLQPIQIWSHTYADGNMGFDADGFQILLSFDWDPKTLAVGMQNTLLVHFSAQPSLNILNHTGKTTKSWPLTLPRHSLEAQQKKEVFDNLSPMFKNAVTRNQKTPKYWPSVTQLYFDGNDRIWVFGPPQAGNGKRHFQVFNTDGKEVGSGQLNHLPLAITHNNLFYIKDTDSSLTLQGMTISINP